MKRCSSCGEVKSHEEFYRHSTRGGLRSSCRTCWGARVATWQANNVERRRLAARRRHLRNYGLSEESFAAMLEEQGGHCATCPATEPGGRGAWHVDHDHACCDWSAQTRPLCGGCVRGILCLKCNSALGHVGDSKERLLSLIEYLDRHAPA